jgi:hypothetical protein
VAAVGIVVNPVAAHDVRRLASLARTVDVHERVNAVARVLGGLAALGPVEVRYMREPAWVVPRASQALAAVAPGSVASLALVPADAPEARDAAGTTAAAAAMARAGVACLVTLGGDGTNRAVAAGWPDAVLLPLPGGTNNVLGLSVEPTAVGLAAAAYAAAPGRMRRHLRPTGCLEVLFEGRPARIALVDVALVDGVWTGARAMWEPALLRQAVVARADPAATGLAGLAGALAPADGRDPRALHLRFGLPGRPVVASLGPGVPVPIVVRSCEVLRAGDEAVLGPGPGVLAFDGEREVVLGPGEVVRVRLSPRGPFLLDAREVLRAAVGSMGDEGGREEVVPRG